MAAFTSYDVDNDKRLEQAILRARSAVADLRIPLTLISKDFFKSQEAIFTLKSRGQYPDFGGINPSTEKTRKARERKRKDVGFDYPLLVRSGRLAKSLTDPNHSESISDIIQKDTLLLGTKVPYLIFHQSDDARRKIPLRKALFIGPEAIRFAKGPTAGRPGRWLNILNEHVIKQLKKDFEVKKAA